MIFYSPELDELIFLAGTKWTGIEDHFYEFACSDWANFTHDSMFDFDWIIVGYL